MILSGAKNNNTGPRNEGSGDRSLSKNPGVDKGPYVQSGSDNTR